MKYKLKDLPGGPRVQDLWTNVFLPTLIRFIGTRLRPWSIDDTTSVVVVQSIWDVVFGAELPRRIESGDVVHYLVRISLSYNYCANIFTGDQEAERLEKRPRCDRMAGCRVVLFQQSKAQDTCTAEGFQHGNCRRVLVPIRQHLEERRQGMFWIMHHCGDHWQDHELNSASVALIHRVSSRVHLFFL